MQNPKWAAPPLPWSCRPNEARTGFFEPPEKQLLKRLIRKTCLYADVPDEAFGGGICGLVPAVCSGLHDAWNSDRRNGGGN